MTVERMDVQLIKNTRTKKTMVKSTTACAWWARDGDEFYYDTTFTLQVNFITTTQNIYP